MLYEVITRDFYATFRNLQQSDFRELMLVLGDGRAFLRFNRPDLYNDEIVRKRPMLKRVLQGVAQSGVLENGRVYPGFRFAFPLKHEGELVGAVDFCLSFEAIRQALVSVRNNFV